MKNIELAVEKPYSPSTKEIDYKSKVVFEAEFDDSENAHKFLHDLNNLILDGFNNNQNIKIYEP